MNELAVSVGVILFPGLITSIICDKIASHSPKWRTFKYVVYSFVFGVICYAFAELFSGTLHAIGTILWDVKAPQPLPLRVWSIATAQKVDINLFEIALATSLAPFVAVAATLMNNYKVLNSIAQKMRVSYKFGDENLFSYYLNRDDVLWVWIRDRGADLSYAGKVISWSEIDHIQEVVLSNVVVYRYTDSEELYSLPSIYLARPTGTFVIEKGHEFENSSQESKARKETVNGQKTVERRSDEGLGEASGNGRGSQAGATLAEPKHSTPRTAAAAHAQKIRLIWKKALAICRRLIKRLPSQR